MRLSAASCLRSTWVLAAAWAVGGPALAQAGAGQSPNAAGIYTCIDPQGRRLTSDRPIPECQTREQRLLNRDGSVRQVIPPQMTPEERAEREAAERKAAEEKAAKQDAYRRDRNLMYRFPNEAKHRKAREAALDTVRAAMKNSSKRLDDLAAERKPLLEEAEFYKGRTLPAALKQRLESVEASVQAQRELIATQEAELVRINKLFDAELERLRKLWAGAEPGSLGPVSSAGDAPAAPVSTKGSSK